MTVARYRCAIIIYCTIYSHLEHSANDASVHPSYGVSVMVAAIGLGIPCGAAITPFNIAAGVNQSFHFSEKIHSLTTIAFFH